MEPLSLFPVTLWDIAAELVKRGVGALVEFGLRKTLNASLGCPRCGRKTDEEVVNHASSTFTCPHCGHSFEDQHVCATKTTVRRDNSVIAAQVQNFRWETDKRLIFSDLYVPIVDVVTANSRESDIKLEYTFSERGGKIFFKSPHYLRPKSHDATFSDVAPRFILRQGDFPPKGVEVAVNVSVEGTHGDLLHPGIDSILTYNYVAGLWLPAAAPWVRGLTLKRR